MTRISSGVHPSKLCDQMLKAEHREIKRTPNRVYKNYIEGKFHLLENLPESFRLGEGHERFFYDKIKYLHMRWIKIHRECIKRGFQMQDYSSAFKRVPKKYYNYWNEQEDENVRLIIEDRIRERIDDMKREPLYNGIVVSRDFAKSLLI